MSKPNIAPSEFYPVTSRSRVRPHHHSTMNREPPQHPSYSQPPSHPRQYESQQYPESAWNPAHAPPRYEHVPSASESPGLVTITAYAVPCGYTSNNEPLYLQFGTPTAAEAARTAAGLERRYWQMRNQAETRDEYPRSPAAINRPNRSYDQTAVNSADRYPPYEPEYPNRNRSVYECTYPCNESHQPRRAEYNISSARNSQQLPEQQHLSSQPSVPVHVTSPGAQSVAAGGPSPPAVLPGAAPRENATDMYPRNAQIHATAMKDGTHHLVEDQSSARGQAEPSAPLIAPKVQSTYHDINNARINSGMVNAHDSSQPLDSDVEMAKCTDSDVASRLRDKRPSETRSRDSDTRPKRSRLNWSPKLHASFLEAVHKLGIDHAVPTAIIKEMDTDGLSRENVASHLQKYRSMLKKEKEDLERKELLETLKSFIQKDPTNAKKTLSDEEVLQLAASRQNVQQKVNAPNRRNSNKGDISQDIRPPFTLSKGRTEAPTQR